MECKEIQEKLFDYIENKEIPQDIMAHITSCPTCSDEYQKVSRTLEFIGLLKNDYPVPPKIRETVFNRIKRKKRLLVYAVTSLVPVIAILILFLTPLFKPAPSPFLFPRENEIIVPEDFLIVMKAPETERFSLFIDTTNISQWTQRYRDYIVFKGDEWEGEPGFHTLIFQVLDKDGNVKKEIYHPFYLAGFKVAHLGF